MTLSIKRLWLILTNILLFGLAVWALYQLQALLVVVFVAFILSSALLPVVSWLQRRRVPGWLAVLLIYGALIGVFIGLIVPVGITVFEQVQALVANLPVYWDKAQVRWHGMLDLLGQAEVTLQQLIPTFTLRLENLQPQQLLANSGDWLSRLWKGLSGLTLVLSHLLADSLTVLILSVIMLVERHRIADYVLSFIPKTSQAKMEDLLHRLSNGVGGYVSSLLVLMLIDAILSSIGLALLGFPFALLFGVLSGLGLALPLIGQPVVIALAIGITVILPGHGVVEALWVAGLFAVIQLLENNLITPVLLSKTLGLHPLATILAIIAGGLLGGITGVLLAIPVLTCLNILVSVARTWNNPLPTASS